MIAESIGSSRRSARASRAFSQRAFTIESMTEKRSLRDTDKGRWLVQTKSSTYQLDLSARVGARMPGNDPTYPAAKLRRDDEKWSIRKVIRCEVGYPMELLLEGIAPDINSSVVATIRTTTTVLGIERA